MTIYSHFPRYCRVWSQLDSRELPGSVRSLLGICGIEFSLKVLSLGLNFPFEISTFFHSLECIFSVSGQFPLFSLLILPWSQKLGGAVNLTFISNGSLLNQSLS